MKTTLVKTLMTAFAFALMVFAFDTNPVMAFGGDGIWASNQPQVDEVEKPDETRVAQYEPDCRWKWRLAANTGNWGWVCEYYNEGEVAGDNVAGMDDEKADQYKGKWFNVDENGKVEFTGGYWDYCDLPNSNCNETDSEGEDVAWQPSIKTRPKGNNDSAQERIRVFSWDTEPNQAEYCWQTVGKNGPETKCVPAIWNEETKEVEIALDANGEVENALLQPNVIPSCFKTVDQATGVVYCASVGTDTRFAGKYHDSRSLDLDRDRDDWNEYVKKGFAYGCRMNPDGSTHCPGDAWNSENDDRELAGGYWDYCDLPYANCNEDANESEVAGLTRRQKQQQDEDDWNAWILKQFAGLRPAQREVLQDKEEWQSWVHEQFAGYMDYCNRTGNCMMLDENNEREIASTQPFYGYETLCEVYPNISLCIEDWWNEDSESVNGVGGRDVADSGDEGSTSEAGATEQ